MTHKRLMIMRLLAMSCLLCGATYSQAAKQPSTRETRPMARLDGILDGLNLTADQKQQVDQIRQEAIETLRPGQLKNLPQQERQQKIQELMGTVREQLKSVLTPQQMEQLQTQIREQRGGGRNRIDADEVPSTQPMQPTAQPPVRGPMLQRLSEQLDKLDLTPDQKQKTDALLDATAIKIRQLRTEVAAGDKKDVRPQAQGLIQDLRTQLKTILTPEQQGKLGELMPGRRAAGADPPSTAPSSNDRKSSDTPVAKATASSLPTALAIGSRAPDFSVRRLSGSLVSLKSFVDKPLVLVFGSYTSPSFRDRISQIAALQKEFNWRVNFLIVYTREAHARGEWEVDRNNDENIKIDQPQTFSDRMRLAKNAHDALRITTDIAVDDMDDTVAKAYFAGTDGAAVISPNGQIVGTQKWCDPFGLRPMIEAAMKAKK